MKERQEKKRLRKMSSGLVVFSSVVLTASFSISAFADDSAWMYDTSKRIEVVPKVAEGMGTGLDAKARGVGDTDGADTVDKWFWTWSFSNECLLDFSRIGLTLIIK